jgi:hypothetical protein
MSARLASPWPRTATSPPRTSAGSSSRRLARGPAPPRSSSRASTPEQAAFVGDQAGGRVFLFLATDDFARDYAAMVAKGVVFVREPKVEPYGTVAVFRDLYGTLWDLIQFA